MKLRDSLVYSMAISSFFMTMSCIISYGPLYKAPAVPEELCREAKRFNVDTKFATIYIYREDIADDTRSPVLIDSIELGSLVSKSFFRVYLQPGKHDILLKAEIASGKRVPSYRGPVITVSKYDSPFSAEFERGKIYIYIMKMRFDGFFRQASFRLKAVDEGQGKEALMRTNLMIFSDDIQNNFINK